jgi:hypothetical protein
MLFLSADPCSTSPVPPLFPSTSSPAAHTKSSLDLRYTPPAPPSRSQLNLYGGGGNSVYGHGTYNGGVPDQGQAACSLHHPAYGRTLQTICAPYSHPQRRPYRIAHQSPKHHRPSRAASTRTETEGKHQCQLRGQSRRVPHTLGLDGNTPQPMSGARTPLSGGVWTPTPTTATSYMHHRTNSASPGSFTGAPLMQAPPQMPGSGSGYKLVELEPPCHLFHSEP